MGYADGFYYGQGRIICDTSTFSVGDTIRVRSMTDSSKVWNQQVATVGTALVFTVPCYDYYKICTVQDIGGTPTEIGGVYKTVDYGQTLFIDVLDKKTLVGMQGILNSHKELDTYNIGDEIPITINDGSVRDWTMLVAGLDIYNSHEVILASKYAYSVKVFNSPATNIYYADTTTVRPEMQNFYSSIVEKDRQFIKPLLKSGSQASNGATLAWKSFEDYVWIPNKRELDGSSLQDSNIPKTQFPLFVTQTNRIKTYGGVSVPWWTCDGDNGGTSNPNVWFANENGYIGKTYQTASQYVVPCFRLTADS